MAWKRLSWWQRFRTERAYNKLRATPLGKDLEDLTVRIFHTESKLRFWDEESKAQHIGAFYEKVFSLLNQDNAHVKFREELASAVIAYAQLQVLCLKPEEKADLFYADAKYVSGELFRHIRACCAHNEDMGKLLWEVPDMSDEDLVAVANTRSLVWMYQAYGWNLVRSAFHERVVPGKDWFNPFVLSMMIFAEDRYRADVGLPSLFAADDFGAIEHSTFMNLVVNCAEHPLYEWEKNYRKKHAESV